MRSILWVTILCTTLLGQAKADSLLPYYRQWALKNIGNSIPIDVDSLTTLNMMGLRGEDIRLPKDLIDLKSKKDQRKVIVAILDTGIDLGHPDIVDSIVSNPKECEQLEALNGCLANSKSADEKKLCKTEFEKDSDGNGYVLDCHGWNATTVSDSYNIIDKVGHGTHVAGVLAASGKLEIVRGMSPHNIQVLPVKVIDGTGNFDDPNSKPTALIESIARGIVYAVKANADVINLSLGWPTVLNSKKLVDAFQVASERGVLIVAAAGNDSTSTPISPCTYEGVICVAAYGPDGAFGSYSNFGSSVDISAPGTHILSTWPMSKRPTKFTERFGYEYKTGTSMAAPYVSAALAYFRSLNMSSDEAFSRLVLGARSPKKSNLKDWQSKYTLSGNLDVQHSLEVQPKPLIYPAIKQAIRLFWNPISPTLPIAFKLKNFWMDATGVKVKIETRGFSDSVFIGDWKGHESKDLEFNIPNLKLQDESEFEIKVTVFGDGMQSQSYILQSGAFVMVSEGMHPHQHPYQKSYIISNSEESLNQEIQTIEDVEQSSSVNEFFVREQRVSQLFLQRLALTGSEYKYEDFEKIETEISDSDISILKFQKLDLNFDGVLEYVVIAQIKNEIRFFVFDNFLKRKQDLDLTYDQKAVDLSEKFQWVRQGHRLVPVWVALGRFPDSEIVPSPWEPKPPNPTSLKLYILTESGVKTIPLSEGRYPVQLLPASIGFLGKVTFLAVKGSDFSNFAYDLMEIDAEKPAVASFIGLKLQQFRLLEGGEIHNVINLDGSAERDPFAINKVSTLGTQWLSLFNPHQFSDFKLEPANQIDAVRRVIGVYSEKSGVSSFAQSFYDLVYTNQKTGNTVAATAKRFSFIPSLIFDQLFSPIEVKSSDTTMNSRPAVYISALGSSGEVEVVVATPDDKLIRPVGMKFRVNGHCREQNYKPAIGANAAQAIFFCGKSLFTFDLKY